MSASRRPQFPVTVTQLPLVRCQICSRTVAHRPGEAGQALTRHYRQAHPDAMGSTPNPPESPGLPRT